ncbi:hypothetical protein [Frondihabitans cladoniiphilus]|uniref:Uncharacterized protein n=1 Tax=Frondihabitans cladoniiphilus TaxID=715785 RepID=A0ABP8VQZ3_9MICO
MPFFRAETAVELSPSESVLWSGRPDPDVIFTPADFFFIPYSVFSALVGLYISFVAFFLAPLAYADDFPGLGTTAIAIAVAVDLAVVYTLVGRFFVKRWIKQRTSYTLTTRRAIVSAPLGQGRGAGLSLHALRVHTSRDGRHVSVSFDGRFLAWARVDHGNTGLDLLNTWRLSTAFYDVAEPGELIQALERIPETTFARQPKPSAENFFGVQVAVSVLEPGRRSRIPVIEHQATEVGWRQETGLLRLSDDGLQVEVWLGRSRVGHLADPSFEWPEMFRSVDGLVQTTLLRTGDVLWADVPVPRGS